ncbi:Clavaminate synthase-like protein [Acorus calamus]|uniref:Clavaminate synthase-like protein n=1 Tax=Acorus calamus TaxID=4465 RepID=A0AAV9FBQ1_ACOCL|nr:Clavaminate synthase-like protein [Acorus calamus]
MALLKEFPSKIFFYCFEPAPVGGEPSIVPSHVIVEKMEEQMPRLATGLRAGVPGTRSRPKTGLVNGSAKRSRADRAFKASDDGSAEFTYGPVHPVREFGGKKAWFLPILGYLANEKDVVDTSFGDGSNVLQEAMDAYKGILAENCVDLKWKKGDVLLVDNLSVQHTRRPGKPPRAIYASICK